MKPTNNFKKTIQAYLEERAKSDELFAASYVKENKSIDECITYIFNTVQKSGCDGFNDDEVFSMAVHYYDEDNIKIGKAIDCKVVVNHAVELTEEDIKAAREAAMKKYQEDAIAEIKRRAVKPKKKVEIVEQPSLFDL